MNPTQFLDHCHAIDAIYEADLLAKAASAGHLPDPALRFVMMTFLVDDEHAEIIDLDAIPAPLALEIRTRMAASFPSFTTDDSTIASLYAGQHNTFPVTVHGAIEIIPKN